MRRLLSRRPKSGESSRDGAERPAAGAKQPKTFAVGLKLLHDAPGSAADIIFVHGLTGDRERTWTAKGQSKPWPESMLPSEIPPARVLTFGYDAYVVDWKGIVAQDRVAGHARSLLNSISAYRGADGTQDRPIIFVCHSLGGLVFQDAMVKSRSSPEKHLHSIHQLTRAVAFLGTPHRGSDLARWGELLAKSIGVIRQTNPTIVQLLRQDSEVLSRVHDDFLIMVNAIGREERAPLHVSCFYEQLPLPGVGMVVPQDSATIGGQTQIPIHHNHKDMARFATREDEGFKSLCAEILRWMRELNTPLTVVSSGSRALSAGDQPRMAKWVMPYSYNDEFVGRRDILDQLKTRFGYEEQSTGPRSHRRAALYGLGGIGKTQIAISFVYWLGSQYPDVSVFWVHASNTARFREALTAIARECGIPGCSDPTADVLRLIKAWLENQDHGKWLMVIDNADDIDVFFPPMGPTPSSGETPDGRGASQVGSGMGRYVPECAHGSVLVTTRNRQAGVKFCKGSSRGVIGVKEMGTDDSDELMRIKLEGFQITDDELSALGSRLEHLPLAMAQAASFIQENDMNVSRYLKLLDENDQTLVQLLEEDFEADGRDADSFQAVTATWSLSFDQISKQNPLAGDLLSFMSQLDRQGIPVSVLIASQKFRHPADVKPGDDEADRGEMANSKSHMELEKALGLLKAFSLISEGENHCFNMHRLVQLVTRKSLELNGGGAMGRFAKQALLTMKSVYPDPTDFANRSVCSQYLPHALAVLKWDRYETGKERIAKSELLGHVACYSRELGMFALSVDFETQRHGLVVDECGAQSPATVRAIISLGIAYRFNGELHKSEQLLQDLFDKGPHGPVDFKLLKLHLGCTKFSLGKHDEAEPILVDLVRELRETRASDNRYTLPSTCLLVQIFQSQGRLEEAEELAIERLEGCRGIYGPEHPDTAVAGGMLAAIYRDQNRFEEAEILVLNSVKTLKRALGEEEYCTLDGECTLASIYARQRRFEDAADIQIRLLEIGKRAWGRENTETLVCMNNLAYTLWGLNRRKQALDLMEECVGLRQKVLGPAHPDLIGSMQSLRRWKEIVAFVEQPADTEARHQASD